MLNFIDCSTAAQPHSPLANALLSEWNESQQKYHSLMSALDEWLGSYRSRLSKYYNRLQLEQLSSPLSRKSELSEDCHQSPSASHYFQIVIENYQVLRDIFGFTNQRHYSFLFCSYLRDQGAERRVGDIFAIGDTAPFIRHIS